MLDLQSAQQLFEQYIRNQKFAENPPNLYEACSHIMSIGGKRIRPTVLLMAHDLFAPVDSNAMHAAYAIELFHNFSLIHDDIMDNAAMRRGKVTVHEKWNMPTAILSGDVMNIIAYQQLCMIDKAVLPKVLQVYNQTAIEVCEGQQMDMNFESNENVSIDNYIEMITLKTSVLLAASMQIGAIVAGASYTAASLLYSFGKNLGISFQLKDDYLDTFGQEAKVGKQIGGDILNNKKTFLLLKAFEKANATQRNRLDKLLAGNDDDKVVNVISLFTELNIQQETKIAKEKYSKLAFESLEQLPLQADKKVELEKLAHYLLEREQ